MHSSFVRAKKQRLDLISHVGSQQIKIQSFVWIVGFFFNIHIDSNVFSIMCVGVHDECVVHNTIAHIVTKIQNIAMTRAEEYGDYFSLENFMRSNKACCEHKLWYTLQGKFIHEVFYRVSK
jgi:hypothetical protein